MLSVYEKATQETSPLFVRQDLPHQASVIAWKGQNEIELTFAKHKHGVSIPANEVEKHLKNLRRNLDAYLMSRTNVGKNSLSIRGYGGMTLRFNCKNEGVCIDDYLCLVSNEKEYAYYASALRKASATAFTTN